VHRWVKAATDVISVSPQRLTREPVAEAGPSAPRPDVQHAALRADDDLGAALHHRQSQQLIVRIRLRLLHLSRADQRPSGPTYLMISSSEQQGTITIARSSPMASDHEAERSVRAWPASEEQIAPPDRVQLQAPVPLIVSVTSACDTNVSGAGHVTVQHWSADVEF
jgi:hypothetical protein